MKKRCLALLSGGLDSLLAIRIVQQFEVEVEAVQFQTPLTGRHELAAQAADQLGVPLTVLHAEDDYLDVIRQPRFGCGRGVNPCVDCRIYLVQRCRRLLDQRGADFLVSGEVLGQRPLGQKRQHLEAIAYHAAAEDLLLRPLSARLLPPTRPEREGWVDRDRLYAFSGRGRKGLLALAAQLGVPRIPGASYSCALTEPEFAQRLRALFDRRPFANGWDLELLRVGRHVRLDEWREAVVGRNAAENDRLEELHRRPEAASTLALVPANYAGAVVLIVGPADETALRFAAEQAIRYGKALEAADPEVSIRERIHSRTAPLLPLANR